MSESKSEMSASAPVGNLKNRIDNNLKLSIPKSNVNFNGVKTQPSTAPATSGRKNQFSDLPMMKNLMKNWDCEQDMSEIGEDDYFVTTPGSIMSTSSLNRKNVFTRSLRLHLITFHFRAFTSNVAIYGFADADWTQSDKIHETESYSTWARGEFILKSRKIFSDCH